jgi:hypothetical protein
MMKFPAFIMVRGERGKKVKVEDFSCEEEKKPQKNIFYQAFRRVVSSLFCVV